VLRKLLPKKDVFFEYMEQQAGKAMEAVRALQVMLGDLGNCGAHRDRIKVIEHEADAIAHKAIAELHLSFITPMDRNDINRMTKRLDDIVDLIESVAQRMFHYELFEPQPSLTLLAEVLEKQITAMHSVVGRLSDLRDTKAIKEAIVEIHTYENEADDILRPAIADLFRNESDTKMLIKWKEVYEHLERATDRCEDIADMVENILLEYA
jgi:hypothetical protein